MQVALGIDPDCHNCSYAFCTTQQVLMVGVVTLARTVTRDYAPPAMARLLAAAFLGLGERYESPPDIAVVEGQEIYLGSRLTTKVDAQGRVHREEAGAPPDSILRIAQVAGAACAAISAAWPSVVVRLPRPKMWKGQVPKPIHQTRILGRYGLHSFEGIPGGTQLLKSQFTHVIDAIGLAWWGLTESRAPHARRGAARAPAP
jgi:hypothetical protein